METNLINALLVQENMNCVLHILAWKLKPKVQQRSDSFTLKFLIVSLDPFPPSQVICLLLLGDCFVFLAMILTNVLSAGGLGVWKYYSWWHFLCPWVWYTWICCFSGNIYMYCLYICILEATVAQNAIYFNKTQLVEIGLSLCFYL